MHPASLIRDFLKLFFTKKTPDIAITTTLSPGDSLKVFTINPESLVAEIRPMNNGIYINIFPDQETLTPFHYAFYLTKDLPSNPKILVYGQIIATVIKADLKTGQFTFNLNPDFTFATTQTYGNS